ncbi:trypsin-like peptidase domain-containing protein [Nitrospira sp. Nam80]
MPEQWDPNQSFAKLEDAVASNNKSIVRELVRSLATYVYTNHNPYDPKKAGQILYILRRRRFFEEMRKAADGFLNNGCSTFLIRKYYAQALVDLGYLAAAEDVLTLLKTDTAALSRDTTKRLNERYEADKQWAEACGLLGRVQKDRYVNARAPDVERNQIVINCAITHYYDCYTDNQDLMTERHWHGINAVALARLAKQHGVKVTKQFDVLGTAETILKEVKERQQAGDAAIDIWAASNAMEASIALEKWDDAYNWAKIYVDPSAARALKIDAFEVAGTLRQLEEVWRLTVVKEPGSLLLPLLRTRLQDLLGFNFEVSESEPISTAFLSEQADRLERLFGGQFLSFRAYCDGVSRGKAVARIGPSAEEHFGTGFLIDGVNLNPRLSGQPLLVTCDHVVSNRDYRALRPNRAIVTFRADDNSIRKFGVQTILWSRPEGDLDVSILRLDGDTSALPVVPWAQQPPSHEEQRVLIFGHAQGGALSFSLGDNRLVDQNKQYLQYRAPTVEGSSGSPVFNSNWELVAVHHRGGYSLKRLSSEGTHEANQGSSVFAIREEVQKDLQQLLG